MTPAFRILEAAVQKVMFQSSANPIVCGSDHQPGAIGKLQAQSSTAVHLYLWLFIGRLILNAEAGAGTEERWSSDQFLFSSGNSCELNLPT